MDERTPPVGAEGRAPAAPSEKPAPAAPAPFPGRPAQLPPGERERTIDLLGDAFAKDDLELEELERRIEAAHRARSAEELRALLSGLPSAETPPSPAPAPAAPAPFPQATRRVPPDEVRPWGFSVGVMGGVSRAGHWTPARRNVAVGIMGGSTLDFREAALPPGVTEVVAFAFWGGVEVIAPPWVRVETSGIGLMGGFDHHQDAPAADHPDRPVLRVTGLALMGGVEVAVRYPGESARDARRRRKEERKARLRSGAGRGGA